MKILHISNDFSGSKVHGNLTRALDDIGERQIVYCPIRETRLIGGNQFEGKHIQFIYSICIKSWYKFVYHYKAAKLYRDLKKHVNLKEIDIIHAHTLFSDGALAYKAHKEFGTKYIVAIRNTDINEFIRLMKHAHGMGRKILLHAERIVFISVGLKNSFEKTRFAQSVLERIQDKIVIQPNGIDDYWHEHISREETKGRDVLYIGDFSKNKNVASLAQAVLQLRQEEGFHDIRLVIVGGILYDDGRKIDPKLEEIIEKESSSIVTLGKIYDKDRLSEIMRSCGVFAMTSIFETFGLVYIEALSQNLPVVYSKGQGIDGYFDHTVGLGVASKSVEETKAALRTILRNHPDYGNTNVHFEDFEWQNIALNYKSIYSSILEHNNHEHG